MNRSTRQTAARPSARFAPVNRLLLALFVALLPTPVLATSPVVPTLPVSAIEPGQTALVRTVFAGDSIETFTAEIVGVLPGGRVEGDVILARATDPRVIRTGVAQGMSGSPVYVNGRLIGALSSGWAFSKEPIFGITPIGEMLAVLDQPDTPTLETVGPTGVLAAVAQPPPRQSAREPPPQRQRAQRRQRRQRIRRARRRSA